MLLIIDDDRMNCDLLQSVFARQGHQVLTATGGREGLALFHQHQPRITLLDLRMPEMDGLTVLKEIRAHDPQAAVIILGGGATESQESQARELGVTDFIRKGLSLNVLINAVQRISQQPTKAVSGSVAFSGTPLEVPEESVLVVDDEQLVRDLLVRFLTLRGYKARGAANGTEALQMVRDSSPDLILLDLVMPGLSGLEALRSLRESEFPGGVIIVTGTQNEELVEEAWALGPQEVLGKPVDLERLLTAIQLVLVCREC